MPFPPYATPSAAYVSRTLNSEEPPCHGRQVTDPDRPVSCSRLTLRSERLYEARPALPLTLPKMH